MTVGERIAQKRERERIDSLCVNVFRHERHAAVYHSAENGANIACELFFGACHICLRLALFFLHIIAHLGIKIN